MATIKNILHKLLNMEIMNFLWLIIGFLFGFIVNNYLPAYFSKKGENLATKEDIANITKQVEEVKTVYKSYYDLSKVEKELKDIE